MNKPEPFKKKGEHHLKRKENTIKEDTYSPYCRPVCRGFMSAEYYHEWKIATRLEF